MSKYLSLDIRKESEMVKVEEGIDMINIRLSFFYFGNDEMNKRVDFFELNKFINKIAVIEYDCKNGNNNLSIFNLFKELGIVYYGHLYGVSDNKSVNDLMVYSKDKALLRLKMISDQLKIKIYKISIMCVASFGEELGEKFLITEYIKKLRSPTPLWGVGQRSGNLGSFPYKFFKYLFYSKKIPGWGGPGPPWNPGGPYGPPPFSLACRFLHLIKVF